MTKLYQIRENLQKQYPKAFEEQKNGPKEIRNGAGEDISTREKN